MTCFTNIATVDCVKFENDVLNACAWVQRKLGDMVGATFITVQ